MCKASNPERQGAVKPEAPSGATAAQGRSLGRLQTRLPCGFRDWMSGFIKLANGIRFMLRDGLARFRIRGRSASDCSEGV